MSGLIKGMEMPKEGSKVTLRVFPDGQCFLYSWCGNDFDFMEYLTAVPVPLHGDLVDRSEIREIAISLLDKAVTDQEANAIREMWSHVGQMPVFISAEEGEA